jgi:nitrogen regulatory protein P-II 2
MHTVVMKRVVIIGDCDLEQKMLKEILDLGATGYTTLHGVQGQGQRGIRPRHAVSGNIKIEVIATAEVAQRILEHIAKNYFDKYAMIGFLDDVEVLYGERFGVKLAK